MEDTKLDELLPKPKHVHFDVPEPFHRKVKMLCAMKGTTIRAYAHQALKEKVSRDEAGIDGGEE